MMLPHLTGNISTAFSGIGQTCGLEEMVSPAAQNMFNELSVPTVVWDEELQHMCDDQHGLLKELAQGGERMMQCKHAMFKEPIMSNSDVQGLFQFSSQVVWDDELLHGIQCQGALVQQEAVFDECLVVSNDQLTHGTDMDITDNLFDDMPLEVRWDEEMQSDIATHESLLRRLNLNVDDEKTKHTVWLNASTVLTPVSTSGLLKQYIGPADPELNDCPSKVLARDEDLFHDNDPHDGLVQQLALGGECWDGEKMICIPPSPGNKRSDPEFGTTDSQVSACAFSAIVVLETRQETIDAGKFLTKMPSQEDKQQLVEQIMSGVAAVSKGPAHVLFNEISHNEMAATHLEQAVFRKLGLFDGDAVDVLVDTFGQVVWDEMPAAIGTYHGSLQYSAQSGNYFGGEKKVESVDPLISRGASHVTFHAISCTDVVWNDDLLNGHDYQEQVLSTTTTISRICAELDKQKIDGLSNCKKLQVYLDNSEVFAELHIKVVWDSEMQSHMDKYGLLQQLALCVLTHVSTPPHLYKQYQNVENFDGHNRIPHAEQDIDSMTLQANDSSQNLEFGVLLCSARHEMNFDCRHLVIFDAEQGIGGDQYVIDDRCPWRRSALSLGNDDMTAAHSVFHQIPAWNPNDAKTWCLAWFSIVGLQTFQHGCLNVPWDPGGNHDYFILAIAWGQAMFCGGGNVIASTTRYMGLDVMGFRPCGFVLATMTGGYIGEKLEIEKDRQYSRNRNRGQEESSCWLPRSPSPISSCDCSRRRFDLIAGHGLLHECLETLSCMVATRSWLFGCVANPKRPRSPGVCEPRAAKGTIQTDPYMNI